MSTKARSVQVSYLAPTCRQNGIKILVIFQLLSQRVRQRVLQVFIKEPETDIAVIQMTANQPTANSKVFDLDLLTKSVESLTRSLRQSGLKQVCTTSHGQCKEAR